MQNNGNGNNPIIAALDMKTANAIRKAVNENGAADQSMQSRAQREYPAWVFFGYSLFQGLYQRTKESDVAPWGYAQRDLHLRTFFYLAGNNYVQNAESIMQQKVQSTDYTIEGPDRTARYVRDLLNGSEFGRGFYEFQAKFLKDYDTCDNGVFVELIGAGEADEPLQGRVQGIAIMDSLRCQRTGLVDYPVLYYADNGERHKIHRSRVWFASDMPSTDERMFGYGFCSLSRAVSMAQTQILWSAYRNEWLDDRFPNGLLALNNINLEYWQNLLSEHKLQQEAQDKNVFSQVMPVPSMDPSQPVSIEHIPFRQIWEGFDQKMLSDLAIDDVAMAWGLDHQDLAPLATSSMGSGAQSTVLDQKARGKGVGNRLQLMQRFVNDITPESVTFEFDMTDDAQDLQQAQIREAKARTVISLYSAQQPPAAGFYGEIQSTLGTTSLITRDEGRKILSKEIPEWSEILNPVPDDEEGPDVQFADVIAQKWYGPKVQLRKNGDVKVIEPTRKALPVIAEVSDAEVVAAREYLAGLGITFPEGSTNAQ